MIPKNIRRDHILWALDRIARDGVPPGRGATGYWLLENGTRYPPKYVVSIANLRANGGELPPTSFSGGPETNTFLTGCGFHVLPVAEGRLSVVTAIANCYSDPTTSARRAALEQVIGHCVSVFPGPLLILFPGGWISAGKRPAAAFFGWLNGVVRGCLKGTTGREITVSIGLDGARPPKGGERDQLAVAINRDGIVACGRKFFAAPGETINPAPVWSVGEDIGGARYPRIVVVAGQRFFLAVCYDVFGIKHLQLPKPDVDAVLDHIHGFHPLGDGGSGDVVFARHGLAGAAKQWACPVFGAATFTNRPIPDDWPSGVVWTLRDVSTMEFRYEDNPLYPQQVHHLKTKAGRFKVRRFEM